MMDETPLRCHAHLTETDSVSVSVTVTVTDSMKVTTKDGRVRFEVHAKPRAKKSQIHGVRDNALEVRVAAPPVDGAANDELVRVIAEALGVAKSCVSIARGEGSRTKLVEVTGVTVADVERLASRES